MDNDLMTELKSRPWKVFRRDCNDVDQLLKDFSNRLGVPVVVSKLLPRATTEAKANSLSSRYGLGRFPLHTDFSTYSRPPRFILFLARNPRNTRTLICNAEKITQEFEMSKLLSSVFVIQKRFPQYGRIIEGRAADTFYRFNSDVMAPKNKSALQITNFIINDLKPDASIDWTENCAALIFNWQALHGRAAVTTSDEHQLERYAFY